MSIKKVTLPLLGSDLKKKINQIVDEFSATFTEYGSDGRLRFDETTKHFYFEVKQADNTWLTKFEVGGSAYVDIMYFLATQAPVNLRAGSTAQYSKEITLSDGTVIERPHFKTKNGEFSFVVSDTSNDSMLFRKNNGEIVHIPVVYTDAVGIELSDFTKIKVIGADLSRNSTNNEQLDIKVKMRDSDTAAEIKTKLETLNKSDRLDASAIKNIPTNPTETADTIKAKLETLANDSRLDASAIKNIPTSGGGSDTADEIKTKLETLSNDDRLDIAAIKGVVPNTTLVDEVNRIKSKINSEPDKVFTYRGKTLPKFPTTVMLGYYLTFYTLPSDNLILQFPDVDLPEGTIISIDNNDKNDDITYKPKLGDRIDNKLNEEVILAANSVAFLVKRDTGWHTAYSGIVADNLDKLITMIKPLLPTGGTGLTITEIKAQLKDRLHTFAEIQTEFASQLHSISDLEMNGFEKFTYEYGFIDDTTVPTDNSWRINQARISSVINIAAQNKGDKHLALSVPIIAEPLLEDLKVNNTKVSYTTHNYLVGNVSRKILITNDTFDTNAKVRIKFDIGIKQGGGSSGIGIKGDDPTEVYIGITDLEMKNSIVEVDPNDKSTAVVKTYTTINDSLSNTAKADTIKFRSPLLVYSDPNEELSGVVEIERNTFEPLQSPGYLAYLTEDLLVNAKMTDNLKHHKGSIWFNDIIVPNDGFFQMNKNEKSYGIQDWTDDDPNVTGGADYLVAFRASIKGTAPSDGFVKIALIEKNSTPLDNGVGFLKDVDGNPMIVERMYKTDEEFGTLETMGVVNAKGLQEFQAIVVDNFADDRLVLNDRANGGTGLMIQCIKSSLTENSKTGNALQQFEIDTQQNIEFTQHYYGAERMDIVWLTRKNQPLSVEQAGVKTNMIGGLRLCKLTPVKGGITDRHLILEDDGTNICDFNFGKIFGHLETIKMRGKDITVSANLIDKDSGWNIGLCKWTGRPDDYTEEIFKLRNNNTIAFDTGWELVDKLFITEDVTVGDHLVAKDFTIPQDANNYAVIIYPVEAKQSITLKLKMFKVDVKNPFTSYILKSPELLNELHLRYSKDYKSFAQDNYKYKVIRYTINKGDASGLPMPIGRDKIGSADIGLDTSVNKIPSSQVGFGEGALKFFTDGEAEVNTQIRLSNDQSTDSSVSFWWAKVSNDGKDYAKIKDSEVTVPVKAGSKNVLYNMPAINLSVLNEDRLALRASADKADGAYLQCGSLNKPMVSVKINFNEIVVSGGDVPLDMLDLSSASHVTERMQIAEFRFVNNASAIILPLDIPSNVNFSVLSINYLEGDCIRECKIDYLYDTTRRELRFNIGVVGKTGTIVIGFSEGSVRE